MRRKIVLSEREIERFEAYLRRDEREPATIDAYVRVLRRFAAWVGERSVTKELTALWKGELSAQGYRPASVNAMLAAVNKFYTSLGREDCKVRYLKLQRRMFRSAERELTRSEYLRLVDAAKGKPRLQLLLETICATGIRVGEVKYITIEAVRHRRAEIALKGKIRTILLPSRLCRKLLKYAKQQKITSGELFLTRGGHLLSRTQIWKEMKQLCPTAQVSRSKVFPHNLRSLFARTFYRACHDVVSLADVLGHSSVETTRIYLLSTGQEHVRQLNRLGLIS